MNFAARFERGCIILKAKFLPIFLTLLVFTHHLEGSIAGDFDGNCKDKILNTWLWYCVKADGVKVKRDAFLDKWHFSPLAPASLSYGETRKTSESGVGFTPPMSGDDLGFEAVGLSYEDVEDLYKEISERYGRAAKHKEENINKMIIDYAAKCCNENLNDAACSNPANVITCP